MLKQRNIVSQDQEKLYCSGKVLGQNLKLSRCLQRPVSQTKTDCMQHVSVSGPVLQRCARVLISNARVRNEAEDWAAQDTRSLSAVGPHLIASKSGPVASSSSAYRRRGRQRGIVYTLDTGLGKLERVSFLRWSRQCWCTRMRY